ncbi:hypothetical protein [Nitratidesulfovibrio vulgaris]|nr:hypothetical protein [Nitratidesulfovibrio vulgaris]ABM29229.1 conserved hypothetical protein [Nitratidesulfovibrio vulgaris DP4]ADP85862.1 hypothetical protein Deval_0698 [Nitratidesulfovibrio vulgaris RCH1]WCB46096.1 hypothetical protein PH214_13765 [Nitratidesulfovibrio vulgaris]GEB79870.1 hypothetical protein DDE01_12850 [Desulfovibrio desulfuricans]
MEHVLVKVYGSLHPAGEHLRRLAASVAGDEHIELDGDLLRVSFEGVWFPIEELMDALRPHLTPDSEGRVDYIDMDAWRLHRHFIKGTAIESRESGLNNVLDFSGH